MPPWLSPLLFLIAFEALADILAKEWSLQGRWTMWTGALGSYLIANTFWLSSIRQGSGLSRGAIIFSVASAILAAAIGILLYRETLSRIQILGVFLGIASLALISWERS